MDRGTTAGLLVHDQNDVGILGSLPPRVDKNLLSSWGSRLTAPQDVLLNRLLSVMPQMGVVLITDSLKKQFAETNRRFYREFPQEWICRQRARWTIMIEVYMDQCECLYVSRGDVV